MKKVLFIVLSVASLSVQAQIELGAKGGLNITDIVGKDVDYKSKTGIHVGGFARIPLMNRLSLQPELVYSSQGGKWYDKGDEKTVLNYLQIPVLLKYTTPFKVFAETGPQIGFLMSAKDKYDGKTDDVKEYVKKTDISWQFGVGYAITPALGVNVRYQASLTPFYEGHDDGETWKERNSVVQIGLSYTLHRIGK